MPVRGPIISVILPLRNAMDTLHQALSSLQRQTFTQFEVLCLDDGSRDDSARIALTWQKRDPRFLYVPLERRGLVEALNEGIRLSRTGLIARMDADDVSHPRRFELQMEYLEARPRVGVVGCLVRAFPKCALKEGYARYIQWVNGLIEPNQIQREIFVESPLVHPSVIMRKEVLQQVGGYRKVDGPEDYDLWLRLFEMAVPMAKVPRVLYFWREHPGRLSRTDPRYSRYRFWTLKAPYLARHLKGRPELKGRPIFLWGHRMAGWLARGLMAEGINLEGFVNIHTSRQGSTRLGLPINPPEVLTRVSNPFVICAVSTRGAREDIRAMCYKMGLVEGRDFIVAG